jgi:ABC-type sulfate transport system substrate-binding protein
VRRRVGRGGRTWDDLIKPGVEVIEPNPFTSGGAKALQTFVGGKGE